MATDRFHWAWFRTGVVALTTFTLAGLVLSERRRPLLTPPEENGVDLARRLAPRLGLGVVGTSQNSTSRHNAYLTATGLTWQELNRLPRSAEHVGRWRGTLYCERSNNHNARQEEVDSGSGCWLRAGPFVFFGDRELLACIQETLTGPEPD
jgi:hypothetical protein